MSRNFTPLYIKIAIAFHCSPDPASFFASINEWDSTPARECREHMVENGLLTEAYQPTEKLTFWVHHLCAQPLPVSVFRIPDTPS